MMVLQEIFQVSSSTYTFTSKYMYYLLLTLENHPCFSFYQNKNRLWFRFRVLWLQSHCSACFKHRKIWCVENNSICEYWKVNIFYWLIGLNQFGCAAVGWWIKKSCWSVLGQDIERLIAPNGGCRTLHGSSHPLVKSSVSRGHFKGVESVLMLLQSVFAQVFIILLEYKIARG